MKTGVLYGKNDYRIEERDKPKAGPNQLVVKIDYAGICGTDIELYHGAPLPHLKYPMVLGHENVGTVVEIGDGVVGYKVGDKLVCGTSSSCPELCPACKSGKPNLCLNFLQNCNGFCREGGYSEYMLIHDVEHTILVKVPDGLDPKEAVLCDVICVGLHGIRVSRFKIGDNVVVSGTGSIGLATIQFLKAAGANKIIVLGTTTAKFPLLKEYGADYCINSKETDDLAGEIRKILGSSVGADIVFECAGNNHSLKNCLYSCVKPGGQVMVLGTIQEPMDDIVPAAFSTFEVDMQFSAVYVEEDIRMFLEMLAASKVRFPGMVTDVISLDDSLEQGLDRKNRRGQIKILIDPSL